MAISGSTKMFTRDDNGVNTLTWTPFPLLAAPIRAPTIAPTIAGTNTLKTNNGLTVLSDGGSPHHRACGCRSHPGQRRHTVRQSRQAALDRHWRPELATPTPEDPLKRGADGLFRSTSGEPLPNDANARLQVGVLEGSNVNAIETMVGMIQTARQFETQMRLLQTAESNDRSAAQLLGLQG